MFSYSVAAPIAATLLFAQVALPAAAQTPGKPTPTPVSSVSTVPAAKSAVPRPSDYVIGPEDILTVVFWREPDISGEVTVRPDGMISLPLLQDVTAAGLTPEQLADRLAQEAAKYIETPTATVTVKQIHSRKVFITGQVQKPGPYPLTSPTTVLQLITIAGGLNEYADDKNISIIRVENGQQKSLRFNYRDVSKRKNLNQNILLQPGDTVVVP